MAIVYRVDLEDQTGSTVAIFKEFISLSYTSRANGKGNYQLTISGYDDRRLLFGDDYIIRVWMKDEAEQIGWLNTFTGIHKTYTDTLQEDGDRVYTSFGPDGIELIDSAEILYPDTSSGADKTAACSTAMIAYVNENATANATTTNGRQDDNIKPMATAPDPVTGPAWDGSEPWQRLIDTLNEIRQFSVNQGSRCDYTVDYLGGNQWEFRAGQIGTDRTAVGLTPSSNGLNGAGNVPVIFGPAYGNVQNFTKSESRYNESNSITVIGQGTGLTRDALTATDTTSANRSPLAKRERVINGNNIAEGDTAKLGDRALANLEKNKAKIKISFKPRRGAQILFRDYFLYDLITAEDFDGNRYHKQVSEVKISVSASTEALIERQSIKYSDI